MPTAEEYRKFLVQGASIGGEYVFVMQHGIADGGLGVKLGRRVGSSLEFMEHRDYQPGDDLRNLDWNVYARTEHLTVKMYREEINPRLDLILDGSASMALPGSGKAEALLTLASLLAVCAGNSGFLTRVWLSREQLMPVRNGGGAPMDWDGVVFDGIAPLSVTLNEFTGTFQHRGIRILLTDLLWDAPPETVLRKLREEAAELVVIQILGRADLDPGWNGNIRLVDVESGEHDELFLDATALEKYRLTLATHQQNWERACREAGARLLLITAEEFLEKFDLQSLLAAELIRHV
ncbi:DUF58 domain-containing protein [Victivallis sp. Marseille-Q1083]|uniref:DUF58 domain-containing protein n=1 Tax=Victivallis sp. Marseille-Q1083 TaxID=2717288 RepID=UPI00158F2339|nr:DUF58 domain-containing protein [Victivallis sp. Marseille-Q1083]